MSETWSETRNETWTDRDRTSMNRQPTTERRMPEDYAAGRNHDNLRYSSDRRGSRSLLDSVADTARKNPLGAALVGMGIFWFLAGKPRIADMARATGDTFGSAGRTGADMGASAADAVQSAARHASESIGSAARQAGDFAGSVGETLRSTTARQSYAVRDVASSARSQLGEFLNEQPLLLAAGAFAIGAAMAASLPLTDVEERVIGNAAESLKDSAQHVGEGGVSARLQEAASAAREEARRQGLTPEGLKTEAAALRDKVTSTIGGVTGTSAPPTNR
jgi:hypothetical protein